MKEFLMARIDEQTNVRLPVELKDWLKARAAASRRSLTAEVILLLENLKRQDMQQQGADA